jgi:hypothetical protein
LLQAHYEAPEHTATWEKLATAVGYNGYRAVSLQYGAFAKRIAQELGLRDKPLDTNKNAWWLWALVRWARERDPESGHTAFVLRRPVVEALKRGAVSFPFRRTGENAPLNCPRCKSKRVATILWGLQDLPRIQKDLDSSRVVLGGCCVSDGDPRWHCVQCGHKWGSIKL